MPRFIYVLESSQTVRDLYLNPVGLLYGSIAQEAISTGCAGRLGGGDIGFQSLQMLHGKPGAPLSELRCYKELRASSDAAVVKALNLLEDKRCLSIKSDHSGPLIMGVVNVTPDSFSDGGDFLDDKVAIAQGQALATAGADILDIGGESTRPGAEPVSAGEELARVLPVIEGLRTLCQPLSIDTRKPEVMKQAVQSGAQIVNDITALTFDGKSLVVARQLNRPVIFMHAQGDPRTMQDNPTYENVVLEVFDWLSDRLEIADKAGIKRQNLMIDPGIGFGKNIDHNLALMANLAFFHGLGVPIVLGASRKRFIGAVAGVPEAKHRMPGSIAAAIQGAASGVQVVRVHDVAETRQALSITEAIRAI